MQRKQIKNRAEQTDYKISKRKRLIKPINKKEYK